MYYYETETIVYIYFLSQSTICLYTNEVLTYVLFSFGSIINCINAVY